MKRIIQVGGAVCLLLFMMQWAVAQSGYYNQRSSSSYYPSSSSYSYTPRPVYSDSEYRAKMNAIYSPQIRLTYNKRVRAFIHVYTLKKRDVAERILGMQQVYFPIIEPIFRQHGMPDVLKYLAATESALNQNAVSRAGATGLWQFMKATGREHHLQINSTIDERRDPYKATVAAARFLKRLHRKYGDWLLAIAAYNCGAGNVNKAIRKSGGRRTFWGVMKHLPRETRGYVPSFIACVYFMNYPSDHYLDATSPLYPDAYRYSETVMVDRVMSLNEVARQTGVNIGELKYLNAALRKNTTPRHSYPLRLPSYSVAAFRAGMGYRSLAYGGRDSRSYYSSASNYRNAGVSQSYTLPSSAQSSVYQRVKSTVHTPSSSDGKIKPIPPISSYYQQVHGSSTPISPVAYTPSRTSTPASLKPIPSISSYRNNNSSTSSKGYGISDVYTVDKYGNKRTLSSTTSTPARITSSSPYTVNQSPSYASQTTSSRNYNNVSSSGQVLNTGSKPMIYKGNVSSSSSNVIATSRPLTTASPSMVYTGNISSSSYPSSSYNTTSSGRIMLSYTVKEGDNLNRIADWYDCSVSEIRTWNSISGNNIRKGQPINIWVPASQEGKYDRIDKLSLSAKNAIYGSGTSLAMTSKKSSKAKKSTKQKSKKKKSKVKKHKVRKGETLWSIAKRYEGSTLASLRKLNGLKRNYKVRAGEMLKVHVR